MIQTIKKMLKWSIVALLAVLGLLLDFHSLLTFLLSALGCVAIYWLIKYD